MKKINETARSLDVILETDVLVVGSGPGGLAAALAAARAGARTALIDRNGCFGGNITQVGSRALLGTAMSKRSIAKVSASSSSSAPQPWALPCRSPNP